MRKYPHKFLWCIAFAALISAAEVDSKESASELVSAEIASTESNSFNWYLPGYKEWSFKHMDEVFATSTINKKGPARELERQIVSLDGLQIEQLEGQKLSYKEHLVANQTDALLVLHKGRVVAEEYLGDMTAENYHNWFSMSKSFIGLVVRILAAEGQIDLSKPTLEYMPELVGSAWHGTTVQMVMDMTIGIKFDEDYHNPESDLYQFGRAARFTEFAGLPSDFDSVLDYLKSVEQAGTHDEAFHYVSLNTEVLGMIVSKVTGKTPAAVMSEKIWSRLGAEHDAYIVQDPTGLQLVSAAINTTLRDAGRFGLMMLNEGEYSHRQIFPKTAVERIKIGGDTKKFAPSKRGQQFQGFSYADQWWHTDGSAYFAKGLFGQWLYIEPTQDLVIVKFSTSTIPSPDWTNDLRLIRAITEKIGSLTNN